MTVISGIIENTKKILIFSCGILFLLQTEFPSNNVFAQNSTYKIHAEDLLEITFWESPEMDSKVRVSAGGKIDLPVIGKMKVVGLTVNELSQNIISLMGSYNKLINQISIKVLEYVHNKVHVTGQVASPGKFTFEEIPNLWDIIMEAGGPLENAQLDEVVVVRKKEKGKIININVADALKRGKVNELPLIYPGDAIHIPGISSPFGEATNFSDKNEYYVIGAIGTPGPQPYENNLNLLDAIGRAGGPTLEANIKEIKYITVHSKGTKVWEINLDFYINNSISTSLPTIKPGSTIIIPAEGQLSPVLQAIIISTVSAALTTVIVFYMYRALE